MATAREGNDEATVAALRRLLESPRCRPFGTGRLPGLFPQRSPASQRLSDSLVARGFVALDFDEELGEESCRLTAAGRDWLAEREIPRVLLEDVLRGSEQAAEQWRRLEAQCRRQARQLDDLVAAAHAALGHSDGAPLRPEDVSAAVVAFARTGQVGDCALDRLFATLRADRPRLTVGQFHDALRSLHEAGEVRLSPWTGPLYQLPQPDLALLIGHEVLYYVQSASHAVAA